MVGADVGIVEADQFGGRTAPEEAIGEAEHHGVVDAQSGRRVDRLPGQPAGCADNLRLAAHPAHALTSTTTRPRTRPWRMSRPSGSNSASVASRSEEHTSELQSLMRISYAVFCLKKKKKNKKHKITKKKT